MREALVDANVLLRLLTTNDPALADRASETLQAARSRDIRLLITSTAVAEIVYVLESVYALERREVSTRLLEFLDASIVSAIERPVIVQSLLWFRDVPGIHFADAYLAAVAASRHAAVMSFDRGFQRIDGIHLVTSPSDMDNDEWVSR